MTTIRNVRIAIIALLHLVLAACSSINTSNTTPEAQNPMSRINIDGITVNYDIHRIARTDVPILVMVHGFGASLESWNDIFPALKEKYSVVRLDLRGHGLTDKPGDDRYSLGDQALLLSKFLAALGDQRIILVGHSYGGAVSLMTYIMSSQSNAKPKIEAIILIDSAGYRQKFPFFVQAVENPMIQFITNLFPAELRARVLLTNIFKVQAQVTSERVNQYAKYFDLPGAAHAINQSAKSLIPPDLDFWVSKYRDISIPVLLIWGRDDPVIKVATAHRFVTDIPNTSLRILDDTGHVPHEERPEPVLRIMEEFLGGTN